ncbi:hypothetical protein HID58_075824, partial [Brassica napus]
MSFNVQAALCFPLGEPLSAFSGRHSMTRRLVLNLFCHGHVDGTVYQGTWPGNAVVRWSEPWIRNLEAGTRNPEEVEQQCSRHLGRVSSRNNSNGIRR